MSLKVINGRIAWKRFTDTAIESYTGLPGEPIVDMRTGTPAVRLCDGLTPMGHPIGVESTLSGIARPLIISPISEATAVDKSPVITASQFNGLNADGTDAAHVASIWNVATDAAFTQMVYNGGEDSLNLTAIDLGSKGVELEGQTQHYVRVAYKSDAGVTSDWSPTVTFTTVGIEVGSILPDGGIVFAQEGGDWLVVAPASLHTTQPWGLYVTDTSLPNVSGTSGSPTTPNDPNSSEYNTDVLTSPTYSSINDGQGSIGAPAAEYCRSIGYDLPNAKDLQLIYNNRAQINAADSTGNLPTANVWSSTENISYSAWLLNFSTGHWANGTKYYSQWVVPFKRIPV